MKNTRLNFDLSLNDVDASGILQPKGPPVKTDVPIFQTPDETQREIRAIKNETVLALEGLASDIKLTRDDLIAFTVCQLPEVQEARSRWYKAKPARTGREGDAIARWEKSDPELVELETVKAAKLKVAEIKAELSKAQAELDELESVGTPRKTYVTSLHKATSMLNSLGAGMERATVEAIIYDTYRTRDLKTVPEQAITNARIHPEVLKYAGWMITGLDPMRDSFGDIELGHVHARLNVGIKKLIELIKG